MTIITTTISFILCEFVKIVSFKDWVHFIQAIKLVSRKLFIVSF